MSSVTRVWLSQLTSKPNRRVANLVPACRSCSLSSRADSRCVSPAIASVLSLGTSEFRKTQAGAPPSFGVDGLDHYRPGLSIQVPGRTAMLVSEKYADCRDDSQCPEQSEEMPSQPDASHVPHLPLAAGRFWRIPDDRRHVRRVLESASDRTTASGSNPIRPDHITPSSRMENVDRGLAVAGDVDNKSWSPSLRRTAPTQITCPEVVLLAAIADGANGQFQQDGGRPPL